MKPYKKYQGTELWKVINESINELIENQDIEEMTVHEIIVGFLTMKVSENFKLQRKIEKEIATQ